MSEAAHVLPDVGAVAQAGRRPAPPPRVSSCRGDASWVSSEATTSTILTASLGHVRLAAWLGAPERRRIGSGHCRLPSGIATFVRMLPLGGSGGSHDWESENRRLTVGSSSSPPTPFCLSVRCALRARQRKQACGAGRRHRATHRQQGRPSIAMWVRSVRKGG
jgi:hypothetical protein